MIRAALVAASTLLIACGTAGPAPAQITVRCFTPQQTTCSGHWHVRDVQLAWTLEAPFVRVAGCTDETIDWDTPGAQRSCTARSDSGDEATRTVSVMVDRTPPLLTGGNASRAPDANGWYREPLAVSFAGTDLTSGLEGCTTTTYAGPDSAAAGVAGSCRDRAGNTERTWALRAALRRDAAGRPRGQGRPLARPRRLVHPARRVLRSAPRTPPRASPAATR